MTRSVAVVGTIFIDCKGFAAGVYHADSRNLGSIEFVHGGVARNVAENLAGLDLPVAFVTTADSSGIGQEVIDRLKRSGVKTDYIHRTADKGMGMWLAILDQNGSLAGSISQMPELSHLSGWCAVKLEEIVQKHDHIALELDLNEQISQQVVATAGRLGKPVYGIPGNLDVVMKHPALLEKLECFICNHHEAGRLWGRDLDAELAALDEGNAESLAGAGSESAYAPLLQVLRSYVDRSGMRSMVVTLGAQGAVYYDAKTGASGHQPVFPVRVVDSSGAGDAFFSGSVSGLVRGLPLQDAVICGTKVAGWTIESAENTCPNLREKVSADAWFAGLRVRK